MTTFEGAINPAGHVGIIRIPKEASEYSFRDIIKHGLPQRGLPKEINDWRWKNLPNLWRGVRRVLLARFLNLSTYYGSVYLTVKRGNGEVVNYGLASMRVVTTAHRG